MRQNTIEECSGGRSRQHHLLVHFLPLFLRTKNVRGVGVTAAPPR
jgi:hypothetical protein